MGSRSLYYSRWRSSSRAIATWVSAEASSSAKGHVLVLRMTEEDGARAEKSRPPQRVSRGMSVVRGEDVRRQAGGGVRTHGPDLVHVLDGPSARRARKSPGVSINDIEVISRQMMRWVRVEELGNSQFLSDEVVDRFRFMAQNNKLVAEGKKPASGHPLLLGITKASLSTDSFTSAARASSRRRRSAAKWTTSAG
jgi:hypothetical protein